MSKRLHLELLKQFEGVGKPLDISEFLTKNFTVPQNTYWIDKKSTENFSPVSLFIEDIHKRGLIDTENENYLSWDYFDEGGYRIPVYKCHETDGKLFYYITSKGLDYLDQYEVNETSKRANNALYWNVVITIILSLMIIGISLKSLKASNDSLTISKNTAVTDSVSSINVEKRLDTLQQLLKRLQQSLLLPKYPKTSPPQKHPSH
jgi:hypothetical protein